MAIVEHRTETLMDIIVIDLIAALAIWAAVYAVARLGYLD